MKKIITVTEKDVQEGITGSTTSCPVALALLHEFPCKSFVKTMWDASFTYSDKENDTMLKLNHSGRLKAQIKRFDRTGQFKAGRYKIEISYF